jgi:hypothetical protein
MSNYSNCDFYFDFALLNGFFNRVYVKLLKPLIVERRFCPYYRLNQEFNLVVARLANIPVSYMEIIARGNGIFDSISTNIAG